MSSFYSEEVQEDFFKVLRGPMEMALERAAGHIKLTCPPCLFHAVAAMGKCRQINNSNLRYLSDVIH